MLTPRYSHAAMYHTSHLYILGGWTGSRCFSEYERYVSAENRWEALPPLPTACQGSSGVVVENSLYALGGHAETLLDLVQKLSFGEPYLGAHAVQAPICRLWYLLFQAERH
jgi:hypothetical protein